MHWMLSRWKDFSQPAEWEISTLLADKGNSNLRTKKFTKYHKKAQFNNTGDDNECQY